MEYWLIFKAFDAVDHNTLIQKLNYHCVRGTNENWFSSFLENRIQFVSINGYSSDLHFIRCGVSQGSILGPLLFLININDVHYAINHCKVHHFADDTKLLSFSNSIKKDEQTGYKYDLKNWLKANKILVNPLSANFTK